jgi:hypothetical protein
VSVPHGCTVLFSVDGTEITFEPMRSDPRSHACRVGARCRLCRMNKLAPRCNLVQGATASLASTATLALWNL